MGDIKRVRRKYRSPKKPWDRERLTYETELIGKYGLRNKREIWRARETLRKYRRLARELIGLPGNGERKKLKEQILAKLKKYGVLPENAKLEDILSLTVEDLMKRRLQTLVYEKGLAKTIHQARQMITHGHISVNGRKIKTPSYLVPREKEDMITFTSRSSFALIKKREAEK